LILSCQRFSRRLAAWLFRQKFWNMRQGVEQVHKGTKEKDKGKIRKDSLRPLFLFLPLGAY
jgi:hypothetical protein